MPSLNEYNDQFLFSEESAQIQYGYPPLSRDSVSHGFTPVQTQPQNAYTIQATDSYGSPVQSYSAPQTQNTYVAPAAQNQYGAPVAPVQNTYVQQPAPQYSAPAAPVYAPPQPQTGYAQPQPQTGYAQPVQQVRHGREEMEIGFIPAIRSNVMQPNFFQYGQQQQEQQHYYRDERPGLFEELFPVSYGRH